MKTVVFTAAPYCYGPTAKAICIAEEFFGECEMIFVGMEPGVSLARNSVFSRVMKVNDRDCWDTDSLRVLANADLLVSALDYRALPLAAACGVPSVFLDTLFWLRNEPPPHTELASVYLAQQFFQTPQCSHLEFCDRFIEVGPILPKRLDEWSLPRVKAMPLDVVVNFGGLQSPAMRPGADRDFIMLTSRILEACLPNACRVRFALPRYLQSASGLVSDICNRFTIEYPTQSEFHKALQKCDLLIATPGLETVYEATAAGVPMVFLPPYNATQLLQNRVYVTNKVGLHHLELPYEGFDAITANTLNSITSQIQAQNANHVLNTRLLWQVGEMLAECLNAAFANANVISSNVGHNQFLLRSLRPHGRKAAAQVIKSRWENRSPALVT